MKVVIFLFAICIGAQALQKTNFINNPMSSSLERVRNELLAMGYKDARPDLQSLKASPQVFKWQNCGSTSDPTKLESLSVSPDPIVLGNPVTVSFKGELSMDINNNTGVEADILIEKSVLGVWVEIPCIDGVGSCNLPNVCKAFHNYDKPCPPPLKSRNIPCHCPIGKGTYEIAAPGVTLDTHNPNESWLTDGEYKVSGTLKYKGTRLACYEVIASLSATTLPIFESILKN